MSADFSLVLHAAQTHAHERSAQRASDRVRNARLAHAGRADKAENGRFQRIRQLVHSKVFDDAFLDFFQTVMVVVERLFHVGKRLHVLRLFVPRQFDDPIEIIAQNGVFGRRGGHFIHAFEVV